MANVQILIEGADNINALARYRFLIGVADSKGKITKSILHSNWTEARKTNELGEVVFPNVPLDPQGDVISVRATLYYPGSEINPRDGYPANLMATAAVWSPIGTRLLFKLTPTLDSETDTDNPPKTTVGVDGKVGAGPIEAGGKYERESGDRTIARTFPGKIKAITLIRVTK